MAGLWVCDGVLHATLGHEFPLSLNCSLGSVVQALKQ